MAEKRNESIGVGKGGNVFLPQSRGGYWPIFSADNRQVAMVKPMPSQKQVVERNPRNCHVPCLNSHAVLLKLCVDAGCKFNEVPCHTDQKDINRLLPFGEGVYQEEYEIEEIIDHKTLTTGEVIYFIKWKGWAADFNTWEPRRNLVHSPKILDNYDKRKEDINRLKRKYGANYRVYMENKKKLERVIREASACGDMATLLWLCGRSVTDFHDTKTETKSITDELLSLISDDKTKTKKHAGTLVMQLLTGERAVDDILTFASKRKGVLESLRQWENSINSLTGVDVPVKIENHVDLEGPPKNFTYIMDYKAAPGIVINEDPPIGCACEGNCFESRKTCCPELSTNKFPYNKNGTLMIPHGTPIFECNKKCPCGKDCPNRIVQRGRTIRLSIFRTHNERGWGIKTQERIKKGAFVMEYVGEVITSEEAEQRGQIYDEEGRTYLFDLDFDGHNKYTVDAAHYGNIAHFMNHSCEPNLEVFPVWINNLDPDFPRLAFFANQDIRKGEELTFDYRMSANASGMSSPTYMEPSSPRMAIVGSDTEDSHNSLKRKLNSDDLDDMDGGNKKRILCRCGTMSCRKYLF